METKKQVSKYEQQALDFLDKTHCELKLVSREPGYYWPEDKDPRDIYTVNLSKLGRDNKPCKTYVFTFGASINDTIKRKAPSKYDILACLPSMSYRMSFEEFCDEFGYSNDSIRAKQIYEKCFKERVELEKIFSESELEELQEIN